MKVTINLRFEVCCAHRMQIKNSPCGNMHGHNYEVVFAIAAADKLRDGMVQDATVLHRRLWKVLRRIDHLCLNEVEPAAADWADAKALLYRLNAQPSVENLAAWLLLAGQQALGARLHVERVIVNETRDIWAEATAE